MQKMTTNLKKELKKALKEGFMLQICSFCLWQNKTIENEEKKNKMLQNSSHILLEISLQNDKVQNTRQFGIKI